MAETMTATTETQEPATESTQATVDTAALQAELERLKGENAKLKNAQSNASSDAAKYKRELQARMSEQEREATQTKELIEQLKADNAALKRAQTLAEQRAGYIGLGFDADTADKAAAATYDGNFADLTAVFRDFLTAHDKALMADAVRQTPRPGVGATDKPSVTREQFDKMGYSERMKLFSEQPELYKTFTRRDE
jgi:hypothetical protein